MKRKINNIFNTFKKRKLNLFSYKTVQPEIAPLPDEEKPKLIKKLVITPKRKKKDDSRKSFVLKKHTLPPVSPFRELDEDLLVDKENTPSLFTKLRSPKSTNSARKTVMFSPFHQTYSPKLTPTRHSLRKSALKNSSSKRATPKSAPPKPLSVRFQSITPGSPIKLKELSPLSKSSPQLEISPVKKLDFDDEEEQKQCTFSEVLSSRDSDLLHPFTLKLVIKEGKDLLNTEIGFKEKSNPYVKLEIGGQRQTSKIEYSTLDPKWNQTFHFIVNNNSSNKNLMLSIYDHDEIFEHPFMGKVCIPVDELIKECSESQDGKSRLYSKWVKVNEGKGELHLVYRVVQGMQLNFVD